MGKVYLYYIFIFYEDGMQGSISVRRRKPGDFIAVFRIFRAFIAGYTGGHPTHFPGRHFCRGEKLSGKNERVYEML